MGAREDPDWSHLGGSVPLRQAPDRATESAPNTMGHIGEKNFRYPVDFHFLYGFLGPQHSPDKVNEVKNPGEVSEQILRSLWASTLLSNSPAAST